MFSFSAEQDAAYAIGWPHLRAIDRESDDDATEVARAHEILSSVDPPWIVGRSRVMCIAYLRGVDVTPRGDAGPGATARSAPIEDDEIDALLDRWMAGHRYWFQIEELVLALEALVGSDVAGTRIAAAIARARIPSAGDLGVLFGNAQTVPTHAALFCLGFVGLRSTRTRDALDALRADSAAARPILDLVLDGAEGCRRHQVRHLFGAIFAGDDPAYVTSLSAIERFHSSLTPRFPFLGGEDVLRHYVARARRGIPPWAAERVVAQFGTIRHPLAIELIGALAMQRRARTPALAWLRAHREHIDAHPAARAALPDAIRAELGD